MIYKKKAPRRICSGSRKYD